MKPTKAESAKLADLVTQTDLMRMFKNAQTGIQDWRVASTNNKGISKGVAYNILKGVKLGHSNKLGIKNAIREFGEFLPEDILAQVVRPGKKPTVVPAHQDPIFD